MLQGGLGLNISLGPHCYLLDVSVGEEKGQRTGNRVKGYSSGVSPSVYKSTSFGTENMNFPYDLLYLVLSFEGSHRLIL